MAFGARASLDLLSPNRRDTNAGIGEPALPLTVAAVAQMCLTVRGPRSASCTALRP